MKVEIETVDPEEPSVRLLERAARHILKGRVVVCPTDTGYAFSANALDANAVFKVFNLKGRDYSNPMHIAVESLETAGEYAHLNRAAEHLARTYLPGGLTLVLPKKEIIPALLVAGKETIGIRIPDNKVVLELARMTGLPLTATSANLSGHPAPYAVPEIADQMGEILEGVSLVLDQGPLPVRESSTIIDLTVNPPQLLRQGKVSWLEIRQVLQSLKD